MRVLSILSMCILTASAFADHHEKGEGPQFSRPTIDFGIVVSDISKSLEFYKAIASSSPEGDLYWKQSREQYLGGKAAMIIWSPSLLDELGGLRDGAPVTINDDPTTKELAQNTGFVTVFSGGEGDGAAYADVRYLGITADANTDVAQEFVEFVLSEGYGDWLGMAPEGKFPVRNGPDAGSTEYQALWSSLPTGVDRKEPLSNIYPTDVIADIVAGLAVADRWGVADGQLETASKMVNARVMSQVIRKYIDGEVDLDAAAQMIVDGHKNL